MRQSIRFFSLTASAVVLAGLAACATPYSPGPVPNSYPAQTSYPAGTYPSGQQAYVEYGRVSNVEVLRSQQQGSTSGVGAVIGGVAGAVLGNQIGGGDGKKLATVVGAVGGAVAGNSIERSRNANTGVGETYRISVQLDNGSSRAYEVPSSGDLRIGDRVKIENNQIARIM